MVERTTLCIFPLLVAFCSADIFSKSGFEFVQREYARAITEYHAVNQTVMHIRATGCKGPISYTINQTDTPFKIDEKGHVWLVKPLNYDKTQSYHLNVRAVGGNGKCVATTQVHFDILNMNKHAPQFELEQYTCGIIENTRELRFSPTVRVLDADSGEAGQVKRVSVVESGIPFAFTVDSQGNVQGRATIDMNAEDVTDYFFDIIAWDGGNPPKSSYPVSLECEVHDVNEFSPKFTKDFYEGKIQHGMSYDNILQLFAKDDDIGLVSGRVCKYIIQEIDIPFKISQSGVISLDQPLGPEADDVYEFQVDAVDCGGKMSIKSATVSISVENPCHEEIIGPSKHKLSLQQCTGKVYVVPDITLNECARKARTGNFSALVHLETKAGKGCDRDTYEASDLYTMCGASGFIDLLPEPGTGREWTKKLKMTTKLNGVTNETSFFFNGKTFVNIPKDVFPEDIGDKFTISTWIKMGWSESRQVIIANTDKERLDRVHFSLSTVSNNLIFVHRRESIHASRDVYCNSEFRYKPVIFDYQWHHIVVVANGCGAKLYLDGQHQTPVLTEPNWTLHNSNLKDFLTVGALWHGKEKIYDGFFTGFLSGLVIRPNNTLSEQVVSCVVGCKEHVNVDGPLPDHFSAETIDFGNIEITGQGSVTEFEAALQNIVYINERMVPMPGKRSVKILSMFNNVPLATVSVDVAVAGNTRPVIIVRGCKNIAAKKSYLKETGVPLCKGLEIDYEGCETGDDSPVNGVHYLDAAVVKVNPPFKKGESFNFPKGVSGETRLKEIGLTVSFNNEELVIRGIAHFSEYEELLREMVYINFLPENLSKGRTFSISVSTLNGKCVSDKEHLDLSVMHQDNRINKFGIHAAQMKQQEEQMPGFVSMEAGLSGTASSSLSVGIMAIIIICSLSIFIFLVVLGIYKYRKRPDTVKVVPPGDEKEEMYWDDTGLSGVRITLNPMQKFQELDLNEDGNNTEKSDSEDEEGKATKGLLEWDNSDI